MCKCTKLQCFGDAPMDPIKLKKAEATNTPSVPVKVCLLRMCLGSVTV